MGAAVGAYTGSLVGALKNMEEEAAPDDVPERSDPAGAEPRKAGVMLAVAVASPAERQAAVDIHGTHAESVEEAEGVLQDGDWIDFDPLAPPKVIS
jgi:hypothetical protein